MTRTISSLNLTADDSPYMLVKPFDLYRPGDRGGNSLWLEFRDGQWTLNDANTGVSIDDDEDLDTITTDWLKA